MATGKHSRVFHPLRNVELDMHVNEIVLPEPCNAPSAVVFNLRAPENRRWIAGYSPSPSSLSPASPPP